MKILPGTKVKSTSMIRIVGLSLLPSWKSLTCAIRNWAGKMQKSAAEDSFLQRCPGWTHSLAPWNSLAPSAPAPWVSQVASSPSEDGSGNWLDWLLRSFVQGNLVWPIPVSPMFPVFLRGSPQAKRENGLINLLLSTLWSFCFFTLILAQMRM